MAAKAKLTADLFANTSRFESGMKRARVSFKSFSKSVKTGAKRSAVAITAITAVLGALTLKQAAVIDETAKLSKALGVNIREFQALVLAASEAGISQEQMGTIITKSQRSITEAARGLKTYKQSFDTLNLSAKELIKLSPDKQFEEIAKALLKVENPTLRTATALEIFGRSGRQVINMLDGFNENIKAAKEFNDKFGISLNAIDAAKVEEANDTFARVKKALGGLTNILAVALSPVITGISNAFLDSGFSAVTFGDSVKRGMVVAAKAIDIIRVMVLGLKAIFREVMLGIDLMILDATKSIFNLVKAMQKIPLLNKQLVGVEKHITTANVNAQKAAEKNIVALEKLNKAALNYKSTVKRLEELQIAAAARAGQRVVDNEKDAESQKALLDLLKEEEKLTKKQKDAAKKATDQARELGMTFTSAFEASIKGGEKFSDVLGALGKDIENILLRRIITEPLTAAITNFGTDKTNGGNILSNFIGSLPSFDTGTSFVSQDMTANIHKGERILTADENKAFSRGANGGASKVSVIINNNAGAQVTTTSQETGDGQQINVMIDQAVAENMSKSGSRTNQAMRNFQSRALIRR